MIDLNSILGASPAIALMLVLNGIGMALKAIPQISNKLIPLILLVLGGGGYPFIGNIGAATHTPAPLLVVYGCGIALAAVGLVESKRTLLEPSSPAVPQPQPTTKP